MLFLQVFYLLLLSPPTTPASSSGGFPSSPKSSIHWGGDNQRGEKFPQNEDDEASPPPCPPVPSLLPVLLAQPEDIPQRQNKAAAPIWGKTNIRKWNLNQVPVNSEGIGLGFNHLSLNFRVNQVGAEPVLLNRPCMPLPQG